MLHFTDTHCHLDFENFADDRDHVLTSAWQAGIEWILNPGIDLQTNQAAIELAENHPGKIYAATGIHPNYGMQWTGDILPALKVQANSPYVVAVGEIGLDYYRHHTPFDQQRIMFNEQLSMAADLGIPVIIHNRDATEDLIKILIEWHHDLVSNDHPLAKRPGVLHSYSADLNTALKVIELNFYIGISGPVTFKNAEDRKSITQQLPLDHLLLETDAPYLTPHPHRGKRNEPAYIPLIAEEIAKLHHTSVKEVAEITHNNACRLFNI